jgi:hypothetical protein
LGVVVVATLLALVAPAAVGTAVGSSMNGAYWYPVAGIETFWGYKPCGGGDDDHAGVRFRGAFNGKGTVLVVVDYVGTPGFGTTAAIGEDLDGDGMAGFVRAWIPVGWCYAYKTSAIESGTVTWPALGSDLGCGSNVGLVNLTMKNSPTASFFSHFTGCLDDSNFLLTGNLLPLPKIWGYFESATPPAALQCGFTAPPTEDELEPGFRITQDQLFLPLIQGPGD